MNAPVKAFLLRAALAACLSVLLSGCGDARHDASGTTFDSNAWKQGNREVRGRMAQSLVEKRILVGKSRPGVVTLLGKPDQASKESFAYFFDSGQDDRLGPLFHVHVEFGPKGQRVKDAWITD